MLPSFRRKVSRFRPTLERLESRVVPSVNADFNGDGYDDLAIGTPYESVGEIQYCGAVSVIYGTAAGLSAAGDQLWTQDSEGIKGVAEDGDEFGYTLAAGDFDGDGYDDLAVGILYQDVGTVLAAGAVQILYGSATGLASARNKILTQNTSGIADKAEYLDFFGYSLAAGDLNGDGFADLAIGVSLEDVGTVADAGAVHILYGSATGLSATGSQFWTQNSTGIPDAAEASDQFGYSLAIGYFNSDSDGAKADLAIGVPTEEIDGLANAGAVHVLYGSASGLSATGNNFWFQEILSTGGVSGPYDYFGLKLAAGDFDGNNVEDLAIAAPYEDVGGVVNAGAVNVIYGFADGLDGSVTQYWHQDSAGVGDFAYDYDSFGFALAAADFNGDGISDLAIGAPYDEGFYVDIGRTNILYGSAFGLTGDEEEWQQDYLSASDGGSEEYDYFGYALAIGDYNGDGFADLAVSASSEDLQGYTNAGAISIIYGSATGLTATGNQYWHQNRFKIEGTAEDYDVFGFALA